MRFTDDGEPLVGTDNVEATIAYTQCEPTSYVSKPKHIEVKGNSTTMRLRDADIECATGNLTQVRQSLLGGSTAVTFTTAATTPGRLIRHHSLACEIESFKASIKTPHGQLVVGTRRV